MSNYKYNPMVSMSLKSKDVQSVAIIFDRWKLDFSNPDFDPDGVDLESLLS